jgi:hypothetical protein
VKYDLIEEKPELHSLQCLVAGVMVGAGHAEQRVLSWNHLLTNRYCGLNPSPNALILFLYFFLHVLDPVSEFRMNLIGM